MGWNVYPPKGGDVGRIGTLRGFCENIVTQLDRR